MSGKRRRVVVDTSTLIGAAILPNSTPAKVLERVLRKDVLCFSEETLAELKKVIARPKFDRYRAPELRTVFVTIIEEAAQLVAVTAKVTDCRDPKDDMFLSLALAANAEVIVTSDSDLLILHPYRSTIAIVSPTTFMSM